MPEFTQKRAYIRTFGCQMNEHDSVRIMGMLESLGYVSSGTIDDADLILFNTCTIREKAHHKAMSEIGRARLFKERRAGTLVGVCGCVAQEEREAIFERYPHVDILFGPDQIARLPELIDDAMGNSRASALELIDDPSQYRFLGNDVRVSSPESRVSAFVSIMKGCNCACSYCIVPKVRGREVCRPVGEIVDEVRRLAEAGTKEVTLLGQNVNAYQGSVSFSGLIRRIADETDIGRIRFTSPHPRDAGDDLVREYAENEKLMPHIHLPVQAGSNAVLRKMRRGYTRERYIEICDALRGARPGMSITTDIIVGFCGESVADFEETLSLMRRVDFDSAFAFKYSPRPGTEAALKFEDDVPLEEKKERLARLLSLQIETSRRKNQAFVGMEGDALATGFDRMNRGLITARLPDNRIVHFAGHADSVGNILKVRVTGAFANSLAAEAIQ
ncbi:MAG: tRNA (N6-isopentenyl adenosine(37)-C2)-methylthiotransferase MiaB [Pseudomonadota bacterium]